MNYTYGKAQTPLENSDSTPEIQALSYMSRNYAVAYTDRTHNVGITNIWQLPFGKGRRYLSDKGILSQIVGGWQVNNMMSIMSGVPFSVTTDDTSLNLPGSNQYADQVRPEAAKLGGIGAGTPYYDQSGFAEVTDARFGNTRRNLLRGPGLFNWDFGLFREFSFTERMKM